MTAITEVQLEVHPHGACLLVYIDYIEAVVHAYSGMAMKNAPCGEMSKIQSPPPPELKRLKKKSKPDKIT